MGVYRKSNGVGGRSRFQRVLQSLISPSTTALGFGGPIDGLVLVRLAVVFLPLVVLGAFLAVEFVSSASLFGSLPRRVESLLIRSSG